MRRGSFGGRSSMELIVPVKIHGSSASDGVCIHLRQTDALDDAFLNKRDASLDELLDRCLLVHAAGFKQLELVAREKRGNVLDGSLDSFRRAINAGRSDASFDTNRHFGPVFWVLGEIRLQQLEVFERPFFHCGVWVEEVWAIEFAAVEKSDAFFDGVVNSSKGLLTWNRLWASSQRHEAVAGGARNGEGRHEQKRAF
ncbi:hypothetical protein OGATHE_003970 [Ogataea polymorpha]|uniref:Uncharacterized protein n=1 Tax=Ogataea polymorpha TaxID=460523 RepID=A0A9P8P514_9ASCO|nr:hypothetical protein OGATHE_003970 [Ogataea polymorpha]